jgi:hypothetical protein
MADSSMAKKVLSRGWFQLSVADPVVAKGCLRPKQKLCAETHSFPIAIEK